MTRRTAWSVAGVTAAVVILACGTGTDDGNGNGQEPPEQEQEELAATGRDGQFEFTVTAMECGVTELGDDFMAESAQGEFCLVDITVENIGDEPRTMDVFSQTAFDRDSNEYNADDSLVGAGDEQFDVWFTDINPGNSIDGTLAFDVPEGTELVRLRLHDSPMSDGVEVAIPDS